MALEILQFAIKNAFRKKLVAGLSIAGIAIGIALMTALSSASAGFDSLLNDTLANTVGDVQVTEYNKDVTLSQLPKNITDIIYTIDSSNKIEAISPEIYALGFEQFSANVTFVQNGQPMPFSFVNARGVNSSYDEQFEGPTTRVIEGQMFESDFEIIVADILVEGSDGLFALDEIVEFKINFTYSVNLTVVGVFSTDDDPTAVMNPTIIMSVNSALQLNSIYLPYTQEGYNYVKIRFTSTSLNETKGYAEELKNLEPKLDVTITGEFLSSASGLLENFNIMQTVLTIIIIVAGGMAIFVAQLMGVNERMKEFAVMKATGWKNRAILMDIILESTIIGLMGALLGFGIGTGLIYLVQLGASEMFITITWQIVLKVLAFGLGLGIASGLIPGFRAASVKPMEVIRGL